jgi:hypothetical protein
LARLEAQALRQTGKGDEAVSLLQGARPPAARQAESYVARQITSTPSAATTR